MAEDQLANTNTDKNQDPISGEPGSHPVGTGIGAALGGAGAAAGIVAGPAGAVVGAMAGAIAGGGGTAEKLLLKRSIPLPKRLTGMKISTRRHITRRADLLTTMRQPIAWG